MRRPLVAGNWKMNGSRAHLSAFADKFGSNLADGVDCEVGICPAFVYLAEALQRFSGTPVAIGAQTVSVEVGEGAFTGEIAGAMLRDLGCRYAIVGHSERRHRYGESDELVAQKFVAAREAGLTPILCIGETLGEREAGATQSVVERQLAAVFAVAEPDADMIIAYEPVWAIGTGRAASGEDAQAVHAHVRGIIARKDATIADSIRILYGGSVKAANAAALFTQPDIDGFLVGGASLDADEFFAICQAAKAAG
ncbi:MAG TPA: triose-phosphate isomerase [Gammaproteobacteria bacterium]|nr:triose-phosphate isomerase [Gammaproteobacteria bacterium]